MPYRIDEETPKRRIEELEDEVSRLKKRAERAEHRAKAFKAHTWSTVTVTFGLCAAAAMVTTASLFPGLMDRAARFHAATSDVQTLQTKLSATSTHQARLTDETARLQQQLDACEAERQRAEVDVLWLQGEQSAVNATGQSAIPFAHPYPAR